MDLSSKELYADSVEFSYDGRNQLLTGIYFSCKVGDRIALLGRNGCGKSTLLKILFGTLVPKHAFIRLNGNRVKKAFVSRDVCYLPQDRFLPTSISVRKSINLMLKNQISRDEILQDEVLAPLLDQLIADLSGGELRYLEIMLLIKQPATFILLDEPFSGVSPLIKERISDIILSLSSEKGFVISDHDYRHVIDVTNKIVLLQNGGCRTLKDKRELEMFYVPEGAFDGES